MPSDPARKSSLLAPPLSVYCFCKLFLTWHLSPVYRGPFSLLIFLPASCTRATVDSGFSAACLGTHPTDKSLTAARREQALSSPGARAHAHLSALCSLALQGIPLAVSMAVLACHQSQTACQAPTLSPFCLFVTMTSGGHPQQLILSLAIRTAGAGLVLVPFILCVH